MQVLILKKDLIKAHKILKALFVILEEFSMMLGIFIVLCSVLLMGLHLEVVLNLP